MQIPMRYGLRRLDLEVADSNHLTGPAVPSALPDAASAVRAALETPVDFPPLRRALTPDDQVVVVVDEHLPALPELVPAVLEHILLAGVAPNQVTLLVAPSSSTHAWREQLPEAFRDVVLEVHDPSDRSKLAYLATTEGGKRIYLNRTLVEAAQVVVLSGVRYDLQHGRTGAEGALYPALSDRETVEALAGMVRFAVPGDEPWPVQREAREVAWLMGQPFYIQVIAGPGDAVADVVAGASEAAREGERRLDARWRHTLSQRADQVVVGIRGDPNNQTFADLTAAVSTAARVVRPDGRIILLTTADPQPGADFDVLRQEDDPRDALKELQRHPTVESVPALQWTQAASHARLAVLSGLEPTLVEELYATPLDGRDEVQRLLDAGGMCLFLEDAHKMLLTVG